MNKLRCKNCKQEVDCHWKWEFTYCRCWKKTDGMRGVFNASPNKDDRMFGGNIQDMEWEEDD